MKHPPQFYLFILDLEVALKGHSKVSTSTPSLFLSTVF